MSCVTLGRPSVRLLSDPVGVIGGRGGIEAQVGCESKPEEFMCDVCAVGDEEKFKAVDEVEQAETVQLLPTPYQLTLSHYLDHCITHYPYQLWCPRCVDGRGREFGHDTHAKEPGVAPTI